MANIVNLFGVQTLQPTIDNDFSLVYNSSVRSENVNEVRLLVDTSLQVVPQSVNIYLPPTSSFQGIWTMQIYVVDKNGMAGTFPINIIPTGGDNINGSNLAQVTNNNGNVVLTIASLGCWTSYGTGGSGGGGGGGVTLPYADFFDLMSNGQLIAGQTYRINDYRSVNFLHGTEQANINSAPITLNAGTYDGTFNSTLTSQPYKIFVGNSNAVFVSSFFQPYLKKYDANGVEDVLFNTTLGSPFNFFIESVVQQVDGKILVGGQFFSFNGNPLGSLVRLNADGTLDTTFATNLGTGLNGIVNTIAVQSNGQILVGGAFNQINGVAQPFNLCRLNADGTLDNAFALNLGAGFDSAVNSICVQSDLNILVGGNFSLLDVNFTPFLTRLDPTGLIDLAFVGTINAGGGFNSAITKIIQQVDTSIVVIGFFNFWNFAPYNYIARMDVFGNDDAGFNNNINFAGGLNSNPSDFIIDNSAKIVVVGGFTQLNGLPQPYIARFDPFGNLDGSFTNLGIQTLEIELQSTGKYVVSGAFTNPNYLARLNNNATASPYVAQAIYTSPNIETIVVKATDEYNIEPIAYSEQYPNDTLQYIGQCNKIGCILPLFTGVTLPDSSVLASFELQWNGTKAYIQMPTNYPARFGYALYIYMDLGSFPDYDAGYSPLQCGSSFASVKFFERATPYQISVTADGSRVYLDGLTFAEFSNYVTNSLYVETIYELGDCYGYVSSRMDNDNNVQLPIDFRNVKYRRYQCTMLNSPYLSADYYGVNDQLPYQINGFYKDLLIGGNVDTNGFVYTFKNVVFEGQGSPNQYNYFTSNNQFENNVFLRNCSNLQITNTSIFAYNTINIVNDLLDNSVYINASFTFNTIFQLDAVNFLNGYVRSNTLYRMFQSNINQSFQFNNIAQFDVSTAEQDITANNMPVNFGFSTFKGNFANNNFSGTYIPNIVYLFNTFDAFSNNFFQSTAFNRNVFNGNCQGNDFVTPTIQDNRVTNFSTNRVFGSNSFSGNDIGDFCISNTFECVLFERNDMGERFQNNTISLGSNFVDNTIGYNCVSNQFGTLIQNRIGVNCTNNNTTGTAMTGNDVGDAFGSNIMNISNGFARNTISGGFIANNFIGWESFVDNHIGTDFNSNQFDNPTGVFANNQCLNEFRSNTFTSQQFIYNNISGRFSNNNFSGNQIYYNNFLNTFFGNTNIIGNFANNTIRCPVVSLDFALATFVYQQYTKDIFDDNALTPYLSYFDGVVMQYVTPINS